MAQGSRRLWRVATTGFGVLICTSLVGCLNWDKSKDTKNTGKQPGPGLYGTPTLPPGGTGAMNTNTKSGQPNNTFAGSNLAPGGGFVPGGSQFRPDATGRNTLTSNPQQPFNYGALPAGGSPMLGAPTPPSGLQPAGGPLGMNNPTPGNGYASNNPPPPSLPLEGIGPPPAPPLPLYSAPPGGEFGSGSPSIGPMPIAPPSAPPAAPSGKGSPNYNFTPGVFGNH